ncbi:MAG: YicC family protein [Halobacteriovoraceae bacterium]|nr:YicC family protein [Halobacteriovoraceae bacterium]
MAIQSMTGFGKAEFETDDFIISVEIKSVNHRFKDVRFKMPSIFNSLEIDLKNIISKYFKRGSFEISVSYKKNSVNSKMADLDFTKINQFLNDFEDRIESDGVRFECSPLDFLRSEFLQDTSDGYIDSLQNALMSTFEGACLDLTKSRVSEGSKLISILEEHKSEYYSIFNTISPLAEEYKVSIEKKLEKLINDYKEKIPVDQGRMLQEVLYYLEKLDIHEELNRITSHLNKVDEIFSSDNEVGRQIDFLVQELNRETNTIGSKSGNREISNRVVQMKVQLEKIREQGLNLE